MENIEMMTIFAKVDSVSSNDAIFNLIVTLEDGSKKNLKIETDKFALVTIGSIYEFVVAKYINSEKNTAFVTEVKSINDIEDLTLKNKVFRSFMNSAPVDYCDLEKRIEEYIEKIDNKIIYDITRKLIKKYHDDFYLYPAAAKLHHAYIGGLAYHTLGMLDLVEGFLKNYNFFDKNYMYAGIILHDIGKVIEFTGIENTEYGIEGQLLGHLVIGSQEIYQTAIALGYEQEEETLILQHMIISHHGQPNFGSAKKPATAEALLLWYIDTLDSKFRVLEEELVKTKEQSFTDMIGVLDKTKIYKHK